MTHVAAADCEQVRGGLVAQPVNAVSSLAFVVAGVPLVRGRRRVTRVLGWAAAAAKARGEMIARDWAASPTTARGPPSAATCTTRR